MQRDKEASVRHELDDQFASLRELIFAPDPSSTGSNSLPLGPRSIAPTSTQDGQPKLPSAEGQQDEYDQHVRELAFDKRSKPKDRTKTEEELALETKEALEKAERQRRRRMLGLEDSGDEENSGKRKRGADDLDDDFIDELGDYDALGVGLEGRQEGTGEEDENEDEGGSDEEESDGDGDVDVEEGEVGLSEDEEGDEDSSAFGSDEDPEAEEGDHQQLVSSRGATTKHLTTTKKGAKRELPFTFSCPATHEEFLEIVEDVDEEDVPTVIQRIRALHHTSLAAENKYKLQVFSVFDDGL